MFYNVVGVSKSFDPMLPTSNKSKRGGTQIGAELLKLEYGQRTPVFLKENSKHRQFGLRICPKNKVFSSLDNISLWLLNECSPTCFGRDKRWASHLYPIYLTETLIKASFESDLVFISNFKRDFH